MLKLIAAAILLQAFSGDPALSSQSSGAHYFDAEVLSALGPDYGIGRSDPNATREESLQIIRMSDRSVLLSVTVSRNGRPGTRNTALDTIVADVADLKALPNDLQNILARWEIIPEDAADRPGTTRVTTRRR